MGTYLVTGGCGFIGSHLTDALCRRGHKVRILDDLTTGKLAHTPPEAEFIRGDIAEPGLVAQALEGVAGCFHLAAIASVQRSNSDWLGTHRTNLSGAVGVFDAVRRASAQSPIPVVFASSAAVYGDNTTIPLSEDCTPRPLTAYGADKLGCELHGAVASRVHRIPTCGLRFFNVYGPRQDPSSPYSGVISIFCDRLRAGRGITLFGDGLQKRDFIHVADVVRALLTAMDNCSLTAKVFNVCTGSATTIRELAGAIAAILGIKPDVTYAPARPGDILCSVGDPSKAERTLGFTASTNLVKGLERTLRQM